MDSPSVQGPGQRRLVAAGLLLLIGSLGAGIVLSRAPVVRPPRAVEPAPTAGEPAAAPLVTVAEVVALFAAQSRDALAVRFGEAFLSSGRLKRLWQDYSLGHRDAGRFVQELRASPDFRALVEQFKGEPGFNELVYRIKSAPQVKAQLVALESARRAREASGQADKKGLLEHLDQLLGLGRRGETAKTLPGSAQPGSRWPGASRDAPPAAQPMVGMSEQTGRRGSGSGLAVGLRIPGTLEAGPTERGSRASSPADGILKAVPVARHGAAAEASAGPSVGAAMPLLSAPAPEPSAAETRSRLEAETAAAEPVVAQEPIAERAPPPAEAPPPPDGGALSTGEAVFNMPAQATTGPGIDSPPPVGCKWQPDGTCR